jgi:hypothetical protein
MNDATFYQRINLLEEDVVEPATASEPRRWRDSDAGLMVRFARVYIPLTMVGIYLLAVGLGERPGGVAGWTLLGAAMMAVMTLIAAGTAWVQERRQ